MTLLDGFHKAFFFLGLQFQLLRNTIRNTIPTVFRFFSYEENVADNIITTLQLTIRQSLSFMKFYFKLTMRTWNMETFWDQQRAIRQLERNIEDGTLTNEDDISRKLILAILNSVFEKENVEEIKRTGRRMTLYDKESSIKFDEGLDMKRVEDLLTERVHAVSISYKHNEPKDRKDDKRRIHSAVVALTNFLGLKKLLFWSDVVGRTEGPWVRSGIEPYLIMPTVRLVSEDRKSAIENSFWMTVERLCGITRGGLVTFQEDSEPPRPEIARGNWYLSGYFFPLNESRFGLARMICNPALYYRRATFEPDKQNFLKYALTTLEENYRENSAGMIELGSSSQTESEELSDLEKDFVSIMSLEREELRDTLISRPTEEYYHEEGCSWRGSEEVFPAMVVLEAESRRKLNEIGKRISLIKEIGRDSDGRMKVLLQIRGGWCSTMRLRVDNYERSADCVRGRVHRYRVASVEEEEMMRTGRPLKLEIKFD